MENLKQYGTTTAALFIAFQQFAQSMGILIPEKWEDYILLSGMVILFVARDPKLSNFIKPKNKENEK